VRFTSATLGFALGLALAGATSALAATPLHLDKAIATQRELVAAKPDDAALASDLGNLLAVAGDDAGAEEQLRRAIRIDPKFASAHFNLARLLETEGRTRAALAEYKTTLRLAPGNAWAQYQIGGIYQRRGWDFFAVRRFGRAFALDPRLADPAFNPGVLDNPLATKAMLYGYGHFPARALPPAEYADRARIAQILLEPPSPPAAPGAPAADTQEPAPPSTHEAQEMAAPHESKVLSERDLSGMGAANQLSSGRGGAVAPGAGVKPGVAGRYGAVGRARSGEATEGPRPTTQAGTSRVGTVAPGASGTGAMPVTGGAPGGIAGGVVGGVAGGTSSGTKGGTTGGGAFRPTTPSTGQLDRQLVPVDGSAGG